MLSSVPLQEVVTVRDRLSDAGVIMEEAAIGDAISGRLPNEPDVRFQLRADGRTDRVLPPIGRAPSVGVESDAARSGTRTPNCE